MFDNDEVVLPYPTIPASLERIEKVGIYLIDTSEYIYLYVLKEADPDLILQVKSLFYEILILLAVWGGHF
jgi:hypothetical protein